MSSKKNDETSGKHDIVEATYQDTLKDENNSGKQISNSDDSGQNHSLLENSLITAVQGFLQLGGFTFSIGAICPC